LIFADFEGKFKSRWLKFKGLALIELPLGSCICRAQLKVRQEKARKTNTGGGKLLGGVENVCE